MPRARNDSVASICARIGDCRQIRNALIQHKLESVQVGQPRACLIVKDKTVITSKRIKGRLFDSCMSVPFNVRGEMRHPQNRQALTGIQVGKTGSTFARISYRGLHRPHSWYRGLMSERCDELEPTSLDRLNNGLILAGIPYGTPCCSNPRADGQVRHDTPAPNLGDHRIAGDKLACVAQQIENLRFNIDTVACAGQHVCICIKREI